MERYGPLWATRRHSRQRIESLEVAGAAVFIILVVAITLFAVLHG